MIWAASSGVPSFRSCPLMASTRSLLLSLPSCAASQALFQQIKDKNTWFISPLNELNAKLFTRVLFVKDYVEDLFPGRATVRVAVGPAPKAPLSSTLRCSVEQGWERAALA